MTSYLAIATAAAEKGGRLLLSHFRNISQIQVKSSSGDLVTEADLASEAAIIEHLQTHCPEHAIWAEESGKSATDDAEFTWVIDPLDGTLNFAHGIPFFAVTLALLKQGKPIVGVTYLPMLDELFTAEADGGCFLNGKPVSVSQTKTLKESLLATGFPYAKAQLKDNNYAEFCYFADRTQDIRRPGAAALDLAYTACGRFDGYWEKHLNPWDIAAGALLVKEAGGQVSGYFGPLDVRSGEIIASNGQIHKALEDGLSACKDQFLKVTV